DIDAVTGLRARCRQVPDRSRIAPALEIDLRPASAEQFTLPYTQGKEEFDRKKIVAAERWCLADRFEQLRELVCGKCSLAWTFGTARVESWREIRGRVAGDNAPPHPESEDAAGEAQQIVRRSRGVALHLVEQSCDVRGVYVSDGYTTELGQQVLVPVATGPLWVPPLAAEYLDAEPVLTQLTECPARSRRIHRGTSDSHRILLLVQEDTRLACLDARLSERHVGVVTEREPAVATREPIPQRPCRPIGCLL